MQEKDGKILMTNIFSRRKMYQCQRYHFIAEQNESCVYQYSLSCLCLISMGRNSTPVFAPAFFVFVKLLIITTNLLRRIGIGIMICLNNIMILGKTLNYARANRDAVILFLGTWLCDKSKDICNESSAWNRISRNINQCKIKSNTFVSKNVALVMLMYQNL